MRRLAAGQLRRSWRVEAVPRWNIFIHVGCQRVRRMLAQLLLSCGRIRPHRMRRWKLYEVEGRIDCGVVRCSAGGALGHLHRRHIHLCRGDLPRRVGVCRRHNAEPSLPPRNLPTECGRDFPKLVHPRAARVVCSNRWQHHHHSRPRWLHVHGRLKHAAAMRPWNLCRVRRIRMHRLPHRSPVPRQRHGGAAVVLGGLLQLFVWKHRMHPVRPRLLLRHLQQHCMPRGDLRRRQLAAHHGVRCLYRGRLLRVANH